MTDAASMNLRREAISGFVAKSANAAVAFVGSIVFARLLEPEVFGAVYLILAAAQVLNKTVTGWSAAAKYHISGERIDANVGLGAVAVFIGAWLAVLALGAVVFREQLATYFSLDAAPAYLLAVVASAAVFEAIERITQSLGRVGLSHWLTAGRGGLMVTLQVSLIWLGLSATGFVAGWVGGTLLAAVAGLAWLQLRPSLPTRDETKEMWQYAKSAIPGDFFGTAYNQLDMLLLGLIVGSVAAGRYRVALALTMPATFMSGVISSGLSAAVSAGDGTGERDPVVDVRNSLRYASIFAVPLLVGASLLAHDLIRVTYGSEYTAAAPLLVALAAYRVVKTQTGPVLSALRGYGRPDLTAKLTGVTVVFNIIIGYWLALQMGALGVALATIIAELLRFVAARVLVSRHAGTRIGLPWALGEQFAAAFLMAAAIIGVAHFFTAQSLLEVLLLVGLGGAVYLGSLMFSEPHRETMRQVLA